MCRGTLKAIGNLTSLAILTSIYAAGAMAADARDGAYHGMIVCERLQNSKFMLIAPLDITIAGKTVTAARPIFNLPATRVVATEIATGTIADDGTIYFLSNWHGGGSSFQGNYKGTITEKGGTLTGTQDWTTAEGKQTRACSVAVVSNRS